MLSDCSVHLVVDTTNFSLVFVAAWRDSSPVVSIVFCSDVGCMIFTVIENLQDGV